MGRFARAIVSRAAIPADVIPCATGEYPVRAARPCYSVLDNSRVAAAFGPLPAWHDALERYMCARDGVGPAGA